MVSVIIPYYDRPEKILRCVRSVLAQTYQEFEILIIDDCSPEALSLNLDSRVHVLRNKNNQGPGLSRNVGLDYAKGRYIAFLDSDDYWHQDFLQSSIEAISSNPELAFVYCNTLAFDNDGTKVKRSPENFPRQIFPHLLHHKRSWATSACLWSKEAIGSVRYIDARNWEDYVFDTEVSLKNNQIKFIPKYLCYYDKDGNDKLSNTDFYLRLKEKSYSIIKLFDLLKGESKFF